MPEIRDWRWSFAGGAAAANNRSISSELGKFRGCRQKRALVYVKSVVRRRTMERSEGVSVVLNHIMKMVDRSGDRLLRSFDLFEGSDIRVTTSPQVPEPAAERVASKAAAASASIGY
jgi:hypothetical protein